MVSCECWLLGDVCAGAPFTLLCNFHLYLPGLEENLLRGICMESVQLSHFKTNFLTAG